MKSEKVDENAERKKERERERDEDEESSQRPEKTLLLRTH